MRRRHNYRRIVLALSLLLLSFCIGTTGFMWIESYTFTEAIYMTAITFSTVGYGTIRDLSPEGELFVTLYVIFDLGIYAFFISVFTSYIFEGELSDTLRGLRTIRRIKRMHNHVIICGFGRNGSRAAREFDREGLSYVVIDQNAALLQESMGETKKTKYLTGDATDEEILRQAGVVKARAIITAMPDDATNVFVALTARELNPKIKIIARAVRESSEAKLRRAGADHIVMPDAIGGHYMASLVSKPEVVEFINILNGMSEEDVKVSEVKCDEMKHDYHGRTIADLEVKTHSGASILGHKRAGGKFQFNPAAMTELHDGDILILIGTRRDVERFQTFYLA